MDEGRRRREGDGGWREEEGEGDEVGRGRRGKGGREEREGEKDRRRERERERERWSFNSEEITVVYVLGQNTPKSLLCPSTNLAWEADGSRSLRRVDDVKAKREVMGCQTWAMVVTMAW